MRKNGPAARDEFAGPGRDLLVVVGCPDAAMLAAAVVFVMDPELPAHPFTQKIDGAAQVNKTGGNPEDKSCNQLVPVTNGYDRSAIKPRAGKGCEASQQADGHPGGGYIKEGLRCGQPVGLIGAGQRPAKQDAGEEEAARMEK